MNADPSTLRLPASLQVLAAMASLLERLEHQPRQASASQYRGVVQQITQLLAEAEPGPALDALLGAAPATAELYENLQYQHAGLCRSPMEAALNAELGTAAALAKFSRR
ncbi:MAG: hypothetical protein WAQ05_01415 [Rubrivivax sp.]